MTDFFLVQGAANAREVDFLLWSLVGGTTLVLLLVFGLMLLYVVRYRAGSSARRRGVGEKSWRFEIAWTVATLLLFLGLFVWGADLYVRLFQMPPDALTIAVTGKQWMWKAEHPGGQREINALHVPVNRPVVLVMTSEDVIHDFSVPAFRIKHDVLPGRYSRLWFQATSAGSYRLFCTQFCGTDHSGMGGEVVAMEGPDYERWLAQNGGTDDLAAQGRALFVRYGCSGCHVGGGRSGGSGGGSTVAAPPLDGVFGHPVPLADGRIVQATEEYLRDSILMPARDIVAGYPNRMPSYAGVIPEADLIRLVGYIRSLAAEPVPATAGATR